ncbi:PREDICTED: uncharacterized protein LOC105315949, partial [Amphimedon queenslandica]|uniref:Uncharacterized protein n=2 Tax=Amphimedon queenslandica TaxID=400682 RepID=A0AAN0ITL6_AMPQE
HPNIIDNKGMTCLHHSCHHGHIDITQYLIEIQHCDINKTDNEGRTLVHHAAWSGNFDLVQYLITEQGYTHFIKHITSQYPQYISLLHLTDNDGGIPLHLACDSGNIQLVTFLINEMKCDVNAKNTRDSTCVTFACFSGNLDLVQLLIEHYKLEPLAADKYGFTAIHGAVETGHTHILEWYSQEYSVDINNHTINNKYTLAHSAANEAAKTSNGSTVLHITCQYSDSLPILKYLIENHQLDLCAVNDEGMAPIHLACSNGRLNLIQYIIELIPSSLELLHTKDGHTPFLIAVYFNQLEVIKYLISKKCNLSATDDEGSGAVHISVERGHLNVLKYLIDNNYCNPNATNHQDRTPLHVVVAAEQSQILEYLLEIKPSLLNNVQDKDYTLQITL